MTMSNPDTKVNVLLVDDQAVVREGLALLLQSDPSISLVGEAGEGNSAIKQAQVLQPDVVLMDAHMDGVSGVEATLQITADGFSKDPDKPVKVLILTMYHANEDVYSALRAGASGFLIKDDSGSDLVAAIHAIAQGDGWLTPAVTRNVIKRFAAIADNELPDIEAVKWLTQQERRVLRAVAFGLSNAEIAHRMNLSENTIKTYMGRMLMKLGLRDRQMAIVFAYQTGFVLPGTTLPPVE